MMESFSRKKQFLIGCLSFLVISISLSFPVTLDRSQADDASIANSVVVGTSASGETGRVLGLAKANCKKCHANEVAAWMKTKHYKTDDLLSGAKAKEYITKMEIDPKNVRKDSMCLDCHATKTTDATGASLAMDYGVSCSSCHGGSGGEDGWLNPHQSFHESMKIPADRETPAHRKKRIEKCEKAGMIRPANVYGLAKNCLSCHIVTNQKLVEAGHKAIDQGFELTGWSAGEVRHNFQQDQKINNNIPSLWAKRTGGTEKIRRRAKFLLGVMADLELCVTNLSKVPVGGGKSDFAKANAKRVKERKELLEEVLEELKDNAPHGLEAFLEAVDSFKLSTRNFKDAAGAKKALPIISKNILAIAKSLDASKLSAIDEIISDSFEPRGKVFQPGKSP